MFQRRPKKTEQLLDEKGLRHKVIELLARREFSYGELEQKLLPLAQNETLLYTVLDWMVEMGLQSDTRFTEMFIRSRLYRAMALCVFVWSLNKSLFQLISLI